ncbi:helix-turn-helix domain-containing protein [Paramicrobacterium agarici]|uniref:helix-turn-helix domain-containing protein n=1 Tax=Paramicrobacterium agarici TaxID=630514 RepID=UPI00114FD546|nr:excisionase family DNA binding protein [Microbacterium agarici]
MKEWVTVAEAAVLTGRSPRTIYEWIEDDRLAVRRDSENRMVVLSKAVVRIEPTIRRGRPRGKPTRRF